MKKSFIHQQEEISFVKNTFTQYLIDKLDVVEVQGPILSKVGDGMQDNLSGIENPVTVNVLQIPDATYEVVHSLAKWKRHTLARFGFNEGEGLVVNMKALRPDEDSLDATHSVYVDQWDWEKIIAKEDRKEETLKEIVSGIFEVLRKTEDYVVSLYPEIDKKIPEKITFITAQELEDKYPLLTPKEREHAAAKEYGAIFLMKIGGELKSGEKHDGRAPDYDDWELNGDIIINYEPLGIGLELSSMGIRVDEDSLVKQLEIAGCEERKELDYHKRLINRELPYTIGGGIGQSRICMFFLDKLHIGEVQASMWPKEVHEICKKLNIHLL